MNRENELGSIEKGKFADLVVLDRDYFRVSDADMRRTSSILTIVAGKVAHDAGVLSFDRDEHDDDDDDHDRGRGHGKDR
ncbi:MAG TPA: amidohydrolase family protein, partial [Burkholderiales bacterium]